MPRQVIIVGGGIAGLAAAHRLVELRAERGLDLELALFESRARLGGTIATERAGGFIVEAGPDSFITEKPAALDLCRRLGLEPRLVSTNAANQRIEIVHEGKLVPLPDGFLLLAPTRLLPFLRSPLFSWRGKARVAAEIFIPPGSCERDESLASFVRRRFGREMLERVAQPLIGGIYAADPEELSLAATMPRFQHMEKTGPLIRAMWSARKRRQHGSGARWSLFVSLSGGMAELIEALASRIGDGAIRTQKAVTGLALDRSSGRWIVVSGERYEEADAVILAAPAHAAATLLAPVSNSAATELREIPYASTATVNLGYRQHDVPRPLESFGFVVPAVENRRITACTFSSAKYPGRAPEGAVLLRVFTGGALQPDRLRFDDETLVREARDELRELLGIAAEPLFSRVARHPFSMPQYRVGHLDRIRRLTAALAALPRIALAGNAYEGVGIPDCVRTGERAAEQIAAALWPESGRDPA